MHTLCICSSTLKKLNLRFSAAPYSFPYGVVMKAPALEILSIKDIVTKPFDLGELPSLVKAEFCVLVPGGKYEDDPYSMVDGMLAKIPNVEKLRLSSHTLKG